MTDTIDITIVKGATSKQSTAGGSVSGERGVGAGRYHWVFENISSSTAPRRVWLLF